ncbi:hypothetical protein GCM10022240_07450 [Microbacterium kribbense]|uniref:DUF3618 domain-containing protein n=1 Tax=Microbacterium kribbense TaxID=433645 RepID=A0ABP7G5V2_9MICO
MSSDATALSRTSGAGAVMPRTAVALGIADPVQRARAELKAALVAIEEKANVPKRVARASQQRIDDARAFVKKQPALAALAVVGVAAAAGLTVWTLVRLYTR